MRLLKFYNNSELGNSGIVDLFLKHYKITFFIFCELDFVRF